MPAGQGDTGEPLVTLEPDADGTFQVTLVPTDNAGRWRWGRAIETSRWVALVFRVLIGPRLCLVCDMLVSTCHAVDPAAAAGTPA